MSRPSPSERSFEESLEIAAPRDVVWEALATAEGLERWFAPEAEVEPREGGRVVWRWGRLHEWAQTVVAWEPGRRLVTRYDSAAERPGGGRVPLFVEFQLSGEGGRTTLRVVHSGFGPEGDFDAEFDGISHGWPLELACLRAYLERHAGQPRVLVWSVRDLAPDEDMERAWERLTGEGGFRGARELAGARPGEPLRVTTPSGEVLEGETLVCWPRDVSGVVRSHGDAFLRIGVEECAGVRQAWLWLATYGRPDAETRRLRADWEAALARLFPGVAAGSA